MIKKDYKKSALTIDKQIALLKERGMIIDNQNNTYNFLLHNNYYKFAGYWKKFAEEKTHLLNSLNSDEKKFDFFYGLYMNDRLLSHILLKYISIMENSLRTLYAYYLSNLTNKSHPHLDNSYYDLNSDQFQRQLGIFFDSFNKSPHSFKQHYTKHYNESLPPIWVLVEILPLGTLIKALQDTKKEYTSPIYNLFDYKKNLLNKFLSSLVFVRNQCAHQSILWNQEYPKLPEIPDKIISDDLKHLNREREKIIINFILILYYLLKQIGLEEDMKIAINDFFQQLPKEYLLGYGLTINTPII